MKEPPSVKGKASPTSFKAPVALAVKMTVYPGGALKNERTASRASKAYVAERRDLWKVNPISASVHIHRTD